MSYANRPLLSEDLAAGLLEPFVERRRGAQDGWFRAMFEQAPAPMAIATADGLIELVNNAFTELLGYTLDDVKGRPVVELTHADDRETCRQFIRQVGAGETERRQYEKRYLHKNGTGVWALVTVSAVELHGRRHLIGQITDLTAVKRANAEALAAADLIAHSQDAIIRASLDARVVSWNDGAEAMLGYTAAEAIGMPVANLMTPECRALLEGRIATLKAGGVLRNVESVCLRKDGTRIDVEVTLAPVPDGRNLVGSLSGIVRDITARKLAERNMHESQQRFREIAEIISEVFWMADPAKTRMLYISPGYEKVWGRTCASLYREPRSFIEGIHPDDRARVLAAISRHELGSDYECDYRIVRPDGSVRFIWDRGYPVRGADGQVEHYAGVAVDVTDRKLQELRLENGMEATVKALAGTVELRDPYTSGHQSRVAELAVLIGRELGLPDERVRGLNLAATIHDIGKLCVPAEILAKPGRLTPLEHELIKCHPAAGAKILEGIEFPWPIREMVWQHHERMDGTGYPRGLKGEAILLESRILAVADVMEAIASRRPYRPARGLQPALAEITRGRGTAYDADVTDACLRLYGEGRGVELGDPEDQPPA